jgi:hypothetical protein
MGEVAAGPDVEQAPCPTRRIIGQRAGCEPAGDVDVVDPGTGAD